MPYLIVVVRSLVMLARVWMVPQAAIVTVLVVSSSPSLPVIIAVATVPPFVYRRRGKLVTSPIPRLVSADPRGHRQSAVARFRTCTASGATCVAGGTKVPASVIGVAV